MTPYCLSVLECCMQLLRTHRTYTRGQATGVPLRLFLHAFSFAPPTPPKATMSGQTGSQLPSPKPPRRPLSLPTTSRAALHLAPSLRDTLVLDSFRPLQSTAVVCFAGSTAQTAGSDKATPVLGRSPCGNGLLSPSTSEEQCLSFLQLASMLFGPPPVSVSASPLTLRSEAAQAFGNDSQQMLAQLQQAGLTGASVLCLFLHFECLPILLCNVDDALRTEQTERQTLQESDVGPTREQESAESEWLTQRRVELVRQRETTERWLARLARGYIGRLPPEEATDETENEGDTEEAEKEIVVSDSLLVRDVVLLCMRCSDTGRALSLLLACHRLVESSASSDVPSVAAQAQHDALSLQRMCFYLDHAHLMQRCLPTVPPWCVSAGRLSVSHPPHRLLAIHLLGSTLPNTVIALPKLQAAWVSFVQQHEASKQAVLTPAWRLQRPAPRVIPAHIAASSPSTHWLGMFSTQADSQTLSDGLDHNQLRVRLPPLPLLPPLSSDQHPHTLATALWCCVEASISALAASTDNSSTGGSRTDSWVGLLHLCRAVGYLIMLPSGPIAGGMAAALWVHLVRARIVRLHRCATSASGSKSIRKSKKSKKKSSKKRRHKGSSKKKSSKHSRKKAETRSREQRTTAKRPFLAVVANVLEAELGSTPLASSAFLSAAPSLELLSSFCFASFTPPRSPLESPSVLDDGEHAALRYCRAWLHVATALLTVLTASRRVFSARSDNDDDAEDDETPEHRDARCLQRVLAFVEQSSHGAAFLPPTLLRRLACCFLIAQRSGTEWLRRQRQLCLMLSAFSESNVDLGSADDSSATALLRTMFGAPTPDVWASEAVFSPLEPLPVPGLPLDTLLPLERPPPCSLKACLPAFPAGPACPGSPSSYFPLVMLLLRSLGTDTTAIPYVVRAGVECGAAETGRRECEARVRVAVAVTLYERGQDAPAQEQLRLAQMTADDRLGAATAMMQIGLKRLHNWLRRVKKVDPAQYARLTASLPREHWARLGRLDSDLVPGLGKMADRSSHWQAYSQQAPHSARLHSAHQLLLHAKRLAEPPTQALTSKQQAEHDDRGDPRHNAGGGHTQHPQRPLTPEDEAAHANREGLLIDQLAFVAQVIKCLVET